jgi:cytoskeleton protein RodZ
LRVETRGSAGVELLDNGLNGVANNGPKRTGAVLAEARIAAGIELSDIARETRVPLRHLKAIDAERHEDLPALPYAVGFVKSYARAVGLDPEAIAAQFRSETTKSAHVPTPLSLEPLDERRMPARMLVLGSIGAVILVIAALSAWGAGMFDKPPPAEIVANDALPAAQAPVDPAAVTQDGEAGAAQDAVAPPAVAVAGAAALPPGEARGPVVLTAREPVWVKIFDKASNASMKIGVLQAGESYTVPSEPAGLLLWTGKAGALDVTVGGRRIPPLGGPVETLRNLSLAPADLLARGTPAAAVAGADAAAAVVPPAGPRPIAQVPQPKVTPSVTTTTPGV